MFSYIRIVEEPGSISIEIGLRSNVLNMLKTIMKRVMRGTVNGIHLLLESIPFSNIFIIKVTPDTATTLVSMLKLVIAATVNFVFDLLIFVCLAAMIATLLAVRVQYVVESGHSLRH